MLCHHPSTAVKRVGIQTKTVLIDQTEHGDAAHYVEHSTLLWCSVCGAVALQNGGSVNLNTGYPVDKSSIPPRDEAWLSPKGDNA